MKNKGVVFIVQAAMIAAIYVVLTYVFAPFSFGEVQIRIAEALTILPVFTPAAIPGLFVGCIVGNILGGAILPDIIFGSIATLIGAFGTYALRKHKFACTWPPVIANMVIVPFVLRYGYGFITEYKGPELGTIALLSNITREIITLLFAPLLVRWFGNLAPISAGGATTMDTTLPIITRYSGQSFVVVSIFHGFVVDFSVPFLVTLFCSI